MLRVFNLVATLGRIQALNFVFDAEINIVSEHCQVLFLLLFIVCTHVIEHIQYC